MRLVFIYVQSGLPVYEYTRVFTFNKCYKQVEFCTMLKTGFVRNATSN